MEPSNLATMLSFHGEIGKFKGAYCKKANKHKNFNEFHNFRPVVDYHFAVPGVDELKPSENLKFNCEDMQAPHLLPSSATDSYRFR